MSGARARAEQENPTKRTVFSSYRQNGWSKAALKPRPALPFLKIVAGFKLVSCRWLPFLAQVLLYPHKLSLIHPQQDQVLPLPDSNPTSFSSYPLLVSASYTRSVLPPLSFTGQTVCVCVCVCATLNESYWQRSPDRVQTGDGARERRGGSWDRMIFFHSLAGLRWCQLLMNFPVGCSYCEGEGDRDSLHEQHTPLWFLQPQPSFTGVRITQADPEQHRLPCWIISINVWKLKSLSN